MEFTVKQLSDTLDSYKQFVDEQQVLSSAIFRQIIDRVNMTSEDLSRTKMEISVFIQQLDTKLDTNTMELKKEMEEMKKKFAEMRQQLSDTNKELQQTKLNLAQSYESEW